MNPPFGGRNGHVPWLTRFLDHRNGIAIVRAYTSAGWFHEHVVRAESILFPKGKTKFLRPADDNELQVGKGPYIVGGSPGHGVVLIGMGEVSNDALSKSGLGIFFDRRSNIEGSLRNGRTS